MPVHVMNYHSDMIYGGDSSHWPGINLYDDVIAEERNWLKWEQKYDIVSGLFQLPSACFRALSCGNQHSYQITLVFQRKLWTQLFLP